MMQALVVVDMQNGFAGAKEPEVKSAVKLVIDWALGLKMPIFILEYRDYEHTIRELDYQLWNYDKAYYLRKTADDGSSWVMKRMAQLRDMEVEEFVVCGVNRDACVAATVGGFISEYSKKVVVPDEATNGGWSGRLENTINNYGPDLARLLPIKEVIGSPNSPLETPGIPPFREFM